MVSNSKWMRSSLNFFTALGDCYGAGIAGKGFALSLSEKVDLRLSIDAPSGFDLASQVYSQSEVASLKALADKPVSSKFASFVRGSIFSRRWACPQDWPRRTSSRSRIDSDHAPFISHIFFEFEHLSRAEIEFLGESDLVTSGSDWASQVLMDHGMKNVSTVHQGVELDIFRPFKTQPKRPPELEGKFLVFSGGKYEYRKGIDLVIAAFAIFRQSHRDAVLLINAFNLWPATQAGLAYSPLFRFAPVHDYPSDLEQLLVANGLPEKSFQVLCPSARDELATVMAYSDCGLFPIRCEGGTNHFLMEIMACGRPVIASYTTGLTDILRPGENCVALQSFRTVPANLMSPEPERGTWHEPSIDEIVAALELLYASREQGERLASEGLKDIQRFAWPLRADRLLEIVDNLSVQHSTCDEQIHTSRDGLNLPAGKRIVSGGDELNASKGIPSVLIISDESLASSPVLFGRSLATALNQIPGWNTSYCREDSSVVGSSPMYHSSLFHRAFQNLRRSLRTIAESVRKLQSAEEQLIVVVSGSLAWASRLARAIGQSELRSRIVLVLHVRVHRVPLHPDCRQLFDSVDAIVTESNFGERAVRAVYSNHGPSINCPLLQILPGFNASHEVSSTPELRQRIRNSVFGIDDDALLIGCWLDEPDHRLGFTFQVFRILANGAYWHCSQCHRLNVFQMDPETLSLSPHDRCRKCHVANQSKAALSPNIHFHVTGPWPKSDDKSILIDYHWHMNLPQRVSFDQSEEALWIRDPESITARFSALDVHFFPADGAALHPSLQYASSAGIPSVTTAFGEAEELFADSARLVPITTCQLHSLGYLQPHFDVAEAVQSLLDLSASSTDRQKLGKSARSVVEKMQWEVIGRRWADELRMLMSRNGSKPSALPSRRA